MTTQFYAPQDAFAFMRHLVGHDLTRDQFYATMLPLIGESPIGLAHIEWERNWHRDSRPFYRVWPKVLPMLVKLDISKVTCDLFGLPVPCLAIELPVGNGLNDGNDVRIIHVNQIITSQGPGISVGIDVGEKQYGCPVMDWYVFPTLAKPFDQVIADLPPSGDKMAHSQAVRDKLLALVATLCLLGDNPELISPVLLSKDDKPDLTPEQIAKLAAKARRRGRTGWNVGKGIEVAPHYRRPHPALRWTGEGRKVPKIVLVSGSLIHRDTVERIPTGTRPDKT